MSRYIFAMRELKEAAEVVVGGEGWGVGRAVRS